MIDDKTARGVMARILLLLLLVGMMFGTVGCGTGGGSDKLHVVATVFPPYDWARELLAGVEEVELTVLMDNGVDLHSYQPSAQDIVQISTCDVFIHIGGESDVWVDEVLNNAPDDDRVVIDLMEVLGDGVKAIPHAEEEHDHEHEHEHDENCEHVYDEHVWLSLKNARIFSETIADVLCEKLPNSAEQIRANETAYTEELTVLDGRFAEMVAAAERNTILVGDRFPFLYMTEDYGLTYHAAFVGCEADTEASFSTIVSLTEKVDDLALPCVLIIDGSDGALAETIVASAESDGVKILTLYSMQSVTKEDIEAGVTYLSEMEKNYTTLTTALGSR